RWVDSDIHELTTNAVIQCMAIAGPTRLFSAFCRYLPTTARAGQFTHIDFRPSTLTRLVRQPTTVRGQRRGILVELSDHQVGWFCSLRQWQLKNAAVRRIHLGIKDGHRAVWCERFYVGRVGQ